ncbi:MAG: PIN domain-containing protein [Candidatus Bathyarchaeia archaeon]
MGEAPTAVVVDTYALMAKATSEITPKADAHLENVRVGRVRGIIHPLITYEFLLQFYKGRIPIFKTPIEALEFLERYFYTVEISNRIAMMASEIRFKSEKLVAELERHLSTCDAITIAIAREWQSPILSGDKDLQIMAKEEQIKTIW